MSICITPEDQHLKIPQIFYESGMVFLLCDKSISIKSCIGFIFNIIGDGERDKEEEGKWEGQNVSHTKYNINMPNVWSKVSQ
jgi:hypothetical protein